MIRRPLLYIGSVLLLAALVRPAAAKSYTEYYDWTRNPFTRDRNPTRPRTVYGVHKAYRSYVFRHDGINRREARIIAQYHLIEGDLQHAYDFRKPLIIEETEGFFSVRFPGKFSVMSKKVNIFIYHIAKADGAVLASFVAEQRAADR